MSASLRFEFRDLGYLKLFSDIFLPPPIFAIGFSLLSFSISVVIWGRSWLATGVSPVPRGQRLDPPHALSR
jgi:hypothetical protein